jgi:cyclopropane-fatty-acyl-phospholipid synthase
MSTSAAAIVEHLARELPSRGALGWAERGWLPDALVRHGIRRLCARRLQEESAGGSEAQAQRFAACLTALAASPIAMQVEAANAQHYELPPAFFAACLGPRLKYSCAYYPRGDESLATAEEAMLALAGERAALADGQRILELGCGWGSLTLWMAEHYPEATILAVSNSHAQRKYIERECRRRALGNVQVVTEDVNRLQLAPAQFDRCVSVEMFEHVRNQGALMGQIARWLRPGGRLFVHLFVHRHLMYPFESGADDWLGRLFFSGGLMPAADTLLHFQRDLRIEQRWLIDGHHYQRTANHWLANQDAHRAQVLPALAEAYGAEHAALWAQRWRIFWMACAELFGYDRGRQWLVGHYRFVRPGAHS